MKKILITGFLFLICTFLYAQFTWIQKANFAGGHRAGTYSFSIGAKGYVGSGIFDSLGVLYIINDFWEYDPQLDAWSQMAPCPGGYRASASTFSANGKGYVCCGSSQSGIYLNDCWEYDAALNSWTQKANFPGSARYTATSFVVGNYAYVGGGKSGPYYSDCYRYDPVNDLWTPVANVGGSTRQNAKGFAVGNYGYVVGGANENTGDYFDLWQYDPALDVWTQQSSYPGQGSFAGTAFALNGTGYAGSGATLAGGTFDDFYSYDAASNTWTPFIPFGGGIRNSSAFFTIGNKAYMGIGSTGVFPVINYQQDWWELSNPTGIEEGKENLAASVSVKNNSVIFDFKNALREKISLSVFDLNGKEICRKTVLENRQSFSIEFASKAKGIYLYSIVSDKNAATGKFVF